MTVPGIHRTDGPKFAPESTAGKWSVGLFFSFTVAIAVFVVNASARAGTWEPAFLANLEMTIPLLVATASALGSLAAGLVSTVKVGDRSTAVILVTAISGMVTLFFAGELLSVIGVLPKH